MKRLEGKVAIVTGGSRGIGFEICKRFVEEGATVYAADLSSNDSFGDIRFVEMNVAKEDSVKEAVQKVIEEAGKIDILINNAGITRDALLNKMTDEEWDLVLDVNLKGVFHATREVSKNMLENGTGSIVNISSIVGEYGNIGQSNYAATKAGVIGLTYSWAKELTRKGAAIRTNAIAPGYINTEMMATVPEKILAGMREKNPLKRLGEPIEIANAALFLASDEASFVNGQVLGVNGGMRL